VHSNSDCLYVAVGELLPMFKACMPVTRCDIQSARFLMPYLLHNVISAGSPESRKGASHLCTALVILPHQCTALVILPHLCTASVILPHLCTASVLLPHLCTASVLLPHLCTALVTPVLHPVTLTLALSCQHPPIVPTQTCTL